MSKDSFEKYLPNRTIVYDYVTSSLIEKKLVGTWLSESKAPIYFCCVNCNESKIDLTKLEFMAGEFPRTSIEKINQYVGVGFSPWNIRCLNCQSIYQIDNGWTEPNNGRMIIILGGVYQIRPNRKLSEIAFVQHIYDREDERKYLANYYKFFLQIKCKLDDGHLIVNIENVAGKMNPQKALQIVFFAEEEGFNDLNYILENAAKNAFEEISKEGIYIWKSLGLKITAIQLIKPATEKVLKNADGKKELIEKFQLLLFKIAKSKNDKDLKMKLSKTSFEVKDLLEHTKGS